MSAYAEVIAVFAVIFTIGLECQKMTFSIGWEYPIFALIDEHNPKQHIHSEIFDNPKARAGA